MTVPSTEEEEDGEEEEPMAEEPGLDKDYVTQLFNQIDWDTRKRPGPHRDNPRYDSDVCKI
jgi:hypothetical protein